MPGEGAMDDSKLTMTAGPEADRELEEYLELTRRSDGVAVLSLNRPKMNALSVALLNQLAHALTELRSDPPGALVVTGGPKIFAAGAEITEFGGEQVAARIGAAFREALDLLDQFPRMTIAAINGYALGGGCELALACDLRFAGVSAKLGQPEILLGIIPGAGGTQRLPRLVGPSRAKDLILSGRMLGADEALSIGLVDRVVPDADCLDQAIDYASRLASGALVAQQLALELIDAGQDLSLADGLALETREFSRVFSSEDAEIGVRSFLESGPGRARFRGR